MWKTAAALICCLVFGSLPAQAQKPVYASLGGDARPPAGWMEYCAENPEECPPVRTRPRDIVLTSSTWKDLVKVNDWVNERIKPLSDIEHWGVLEKWSLPADGYGDCKDYALLKRKLLLDNGWPKEALLITVVRNKKNEGHAVLTVKTDKGEFILDNQNSEILPWTATGYRFIKRQSQAGANAWVSIAEEYTPPSTASPLNGNNATR